MNYRSIFKIIGVFLIILSGVMLIPAGYALISGEDLLAPFAYAILAKLMVGGLLIMLSPGKIKITFQDGYALVTFSWLILSIFGALPFYLGNYTSSFIDAFFEAMSGYTTTGSSIFTDIEGLPNTLNLWRSMMQWLGGVGIVVLYIAIIPYFDMGGMSLYQAEGLSKEKLTPRIQDTAKIIWLGYITTTFIGVIVLHFLGMSIFDAVIHSMAAISTGGFSSKNNSIEFFDSVPIEMALIVLMLLGSINFALHFRCINKGMKFKEYIRDAEFKTFTLLILAVSLIIALYLTFNGGDFLTSFRHSFFNVISVISTTGFSSINYGLWPLLPLLLLLILTLTGGCAGSTNGGIKLIRIIIILKTLKVQLNRMLHPSSVTILKINNSRIHDTALNSIVGFILMYSFCALVSITLVSIETENFFTAFSAVIASLGNVGPGLDEVGPGYNYSSLGPISKLVLSFDMLLGRLEILTVIILFYPKFWQAR